MNDIHSQFTLPDGRKLGYTEFGKSDGVPVLYQHGWPACRLEASLYADAASAASVRLIAADRPGFGFSDFQPNRTLLDWPADLSGLADHLDLERFFILGPSGGGPYVAACAHQIPDRLLGATIVAGLSPMTDKRTREGMRKMNQFLLSVGRPFPLLLNLMMKMTRKMGQDPEKLMKGMSDLPEIDKALISDRIPKLVELIRESFVQGTAGATHEGRIYATRWGFELSEIGIPVTIWQGSLDVNVPRSNGQLYADEIPEGVLNLVEGEGHFSLSINHGERILRDLVGKEK